MTPPSPKPIDWEAFYRGYRMPGYVPSFEIMHKIGGGAFGLVYRARKQSIGRDYAIKFLKVDDEPVRDAIARELESLRFFAQLDHPNLVSIEDRGEVDGIPYIVMGYAGDETLRTRMDAGPLPRDEAMEIFLQVAHGVAALHDHSLVHFDLKPANVFLKGGLARVGDYGLSRLVTQSRNSLSFGRGTPYYMAPELLQRRGDHRSDIYSLGIVLYESLVGRVPFTGDSEWEVLRKHEVEPPDLPDFLTDAERQVIARCLAKRPAERFANVGEIIERLQPEPAPLEIAAEAATPALPTRRPRRRVAKLLWAAALFTVVVLPFTVHRHQIRAEHERRAWVAHLPARISVHAPIASQRHRRSQTLEARVSRFATQQLKGLARAVAASELTPALRKALSDARQDVRRELKQMDLPGLDRALGRVEHVLERLIHELDARLAHMSDDHDDCDVVRPR
ncbi:MAG: serine/threonine-protein kinase [Planctomycetota bacterium]